MSSGEALWILKKWERQETSLSLHTKTADGFLLTKPSITVAVSAVSEVLRLVLFGEGDSETLDLYGATFASVPDTLIPPLSLQITFSDGKSIVLSDRRSTS